MATSTCTRSSSGRRARCWSTSSEPAWGIRWRTSASSRRTSSRSLYREEPRERRRSASARRSGRGRSGLRPGRGGRTSPISPPPVWRAVRCSACGASTPDGRSGERSSCVWRSTCRPAAHPGGGHRPGGSSNMPRSGLRASGGRSSTPARSGRGRAISRTRTVSGDSARTWRRTTRSWRCARSMIRPSPEWRGGRAVVRSSRTERVVGSHSRLPRRTARRPDTSRCCGRRGRGGCSGTPAPWKRYLPGSPRSRRHPPSCNRTFGRASSSSRRFPARSCTRSWREVPPSGRSSGRRRRWQPSTRCRLRPPWEATVYAEIVARHFPERAAAYRSALASLPSAPRPDGPGRLVHGDLHDRNVLVGADRVAILDLEMLHARSPGEDVGNLMGHLVLRALQRGATVREGQAQGGVFLEAYRDAGGVVDDDDVAAVASRTLFRLACLYLYRRRWQALTPALLAEGASRGRPPWRTGRR